MGLSHGLMTVSSASESVADRARGCVCVSVSVCRRDGPGTSVSDSVGVAGPEDFRRRLEDGCMVRFGTVISSSDSTKPEKSLNGSREKCDGIVVVSPVALRFALAARFFVPAVAGAAGMATGRPESDLPGLSRALTTSLKLRGEPRWVAVNGFRGGGGVFRLSDPDWSSSSSSSSSISSVSSLDSDAS